MDNDKQSPKSSSHTPKAADMDLINKLLKKKKICYHFMKIGKMPVNVCHIIKMLWKILDEFFFRVNDISEKR